MVAVVLRREKGTPLTSNEADNNFENLKDAVEAIQAVDPSGLAVRVTGLEESAVYFAATKAAGAALAASLPNGATVIVEADESQSDFRVRYSVVSGVLNGGVVDDAGRVRVDAEISGEVGHSVATYVRQIVSLHRFMTQGEIDDSLSATPVLDHSAAIDAALSYCRSTFKAAPGRTISAVGYSDALYLPHGHYRYNGAGFSQSAGNILLVAEKNSVTVTIVPSIYLIQASDVVSSIFVKGIHFIGGKGVLRLTNTGANVAGQNVIEDCLFDNYTECAVGNNSTDHPYWKIYRNQFKGAAAGGTIGIALGGYLDDTTISDNEFMRNKYHLKIGPRIGGGVHIENNDFIRFTSGITSADIWFVPNTTDASGATSGYNTVVEDNKFGGEFLSASDVRILIALEDDGSGVDRLSKSHSATFDASTAFFSGLSVERNRISAISNMTAPFIRSYINELRLLTYRKNMHDGQYQYMCEFMGSNLSENSYVTRQWDIDIAPTRNSQTPYTLGVTNVPHGIVWDRFGYMQSSPDVMLAGNSLGDDASHVSLAILNGNAEFSVFGGASKSAVADIYAKGSRASEITVANALSSGTANPISGVVANTIAWLEIDLRIGDTLPVSRVRVEVRNSATAVSAVRRTVNLTSAWRTVRVPFSMPDSSSPASWQVRVLAEDFSAGVAEKFQMARIRVYHGRQPMNGNHLRTLGSGRWDGEHIVTASAAVWFDDFSMMRSKTTSPNSASDGNVFGQKVSVPSTATSSGAPGQWAADTSFFYSYTGDGTTHSWRRVAHAAW